MSLIVHPHLHRRRSGVTAHTEVIVPELNSLLETRAIGPVLPDVVPRIGWRELLRRARSEDVVWHAHRNNELLLAFVLRLLLPRMKVVFTRHGPRYPTRFSRFIARFSERLITLNPQSAGWMEHPSTIITHGVDLTRFRPPEDRAVAWAARGLGGQHGIGVVGRVRPNKGQGDFVEAIAPLLSAHPEWKPVLVGLLKDSERAWADGLRENTNGALSLAGEFSDVAPWYQALSILVHPSYAEAFSMVLVEGMAAGCCVVVSRLPHVPAVVEEGRTGFMFEPGDVGALREILRMLLRDPQRVAAVGRNAAEEARARFGVEHEAKALERLYRELLTSSERTALLSP